MPLTINAPDVERRLQQEATRQGLSADVLVLHLLQTHLPVPQATQEGSQEQAAQNANNEPIQQAPEELPFYATATPEEWVARFEEWINSHPKREPLPPEAYERASFYEDERHLIREAH